MTLDELIWLARSVDADRSRRPEVIDEDDGAPVVYVRERLARAILDLLGESSLCGFEEPTISNDGIGIPASWATYVSAEEARGMAVMLLRAGEVVADG